MSATDSRKPATPPAALGLRVALAAGIAGVILLLAVFAYSLAHSQQQAREDVEQRFQDVSAVSAALTNGIFDVSQGATVQQAKAQLSGRIDPARLEALARRGRSAYLEVFGERGRLLGATKRAPGGRPGPAVRAALDSGRAMLSDVIGRGPRGVVEWAIPFSTDSGRRVQVTAIPLTTLGVFLASFLGRVPNFADSQSVVLDGRGVVLGGSDLKTPLGRPLGDRELREAVRDHVDGSYGDDRYFATAAIGGSPWKVTLSTEQSDLYSSVNGSRRTVPWLLFAAFALAAIAGLLLLRRSALAAAELQRKELSERHAVEINDNIIQGLALASYELQRGERMAGSSQVADTLREAQRLVSDLLGADEVMPGQLRRETAARTDRPRLSEPDRQPEPEDGE